MNGCETVFYDYGRNRILKVKEIQGKYSNLRRDVDCVAVKVCKAVCFT
jgi:hypothetical protein